MLFEDGRKLSASFALTLVVLDRCPHSKSEVTTPTWAVRVSFNEPQQAPCIMMARH